ncbi:hypothetical protein ARMGADRAFT_1166737 [Armillaria gallica]|uniref:Uncharacterized protein n=1 Tax=Armillaria gallica TaxID=47427 RepID=A0A2H3D681_ARMGA|nr:hypothetical protein ARMGADRAFT_1166737 [Armillaria gallica]
MAPVQTNTPPLTDTEKAIIFQGLDGPLYATILYSLLCGLYTGILVVTLWTISTVKPRHIGRAMVIIILLLHIATIINLAIQWSETHSIFVDHGQNLLTKYAVYVSPDTVTSIGAGIVGAICSILADSTMIWRCWLVWGRRWLAILLPVIFLISATVFKIIDTYQKYIDPYGSTIGWVLYTSFMLASTLWCTSLIIYRIVTVARAGGGLGNYRHVLEVLVESSALFSVSLILYIAFLARNDISSIYFDTLAAFARGVAPTILVGRVAGGHARPDDSWQGSVTSGSLHFRNSTTGSRSSQSNSMTSHDLEAPEQEIDNEYGHFTPVADSREGGAREDGSEVQRGRDTIYCHCASAESLGDVSVDSESEICQDSSDVQQERDDE